MSGVFAEYTSRFLVLGGILIALVLVFFTISILIVPFVAALFVVYLVEPALTRLQRHSFSPGNAFLLTFSPDSPAWASRCSSSHPG